MKLPLTVGPLTIHPDRGRTKAEHMGRFGGGWQYRLGFTAGTITRKDGGTILVSFLVKEYRVTYRPKGSRYRKDPS